MNPASTATLGKIQTKKKQNSKAKSKAKYLITEKTKTISIRVGIIVLVLGILALGSWRIAKSQEGKILPKVMVAGLKVGGKTPQEAKQILQNYVDQLNNKGPEIVYSDQTIQPKLSEMGVTFNVEKVVDEAYNFGRSGSLKERITENSQMLFKPTNIDLSQQFDEKKLDEYLSQIAQVVEIAPVNASLSIHNGGISLSPSKIGRGLDKEKLKNDLNNLINSGQTSGKIVLVTSDLEPQIKEPGTVEASLQAEKYMAATPITITFEDKTFTANKAEIGSWIGFRENSDKLSAYIADSELGGFVGWVASQIEIPKIDKEIMEGTGEVLNEGQDGRGVNTDRLFAEIKERVLAYSSGSPIAVGVFPIPKGQITKNPHAQPGRYPGRYIDINLAEQTLYAFEGSNLVNQFLVSAGLTGPTPVGEFAIYAKDRSTLMDGPGYYLPNVEWVSWFTGDYSIHGTYWHHNFGHPMSHGCVNASNGDAEWLFGWADIGTPVYIHW